MDMLKFVAEMLESVTVVAAFIGLVWSIRCTHCIRTPHSIIGMIILGFTLWVFYSHMHTPDSSHIYIDVEYIFILSMIAANSYLMGHKVISLSRNRRNKDKKAWNHVNRRKVV